MLYQNVEKITMWSMIKGPTKVPLNSIAGIVYGSTTMTFAKHKKLIIRNERRKRKYAKHMESSFNARQETFENFEIV